MAVARKHLGSIKTIGALVDRRRARTSAGALLEMSVLANEKERLNQELAAAARRQAAIVARLAEIAEKEGRLQAFVKNPEQVNRVSQSPPAEPPRRVKAKEIGY